MYSVASRQAWRRQHYARHHKRPGGKSGTVKKKSATCFHTEERFGIFTAANENKERPALGPKEMTNANQAERRKAIVGTLFITFCFGGGKRCLLLGYVRSVSKEKCAVKE